MHERRRLLEQNPKFHPAVVQGVPLNVYDVYFRKDNQIQEIMVANLHKLITEKCSNLKAILNEKS